MTKPDKPLKSDELVPPSSFCWNEACSDYGRVNAGNIRKFGLTRKGRQRWQCATCGKVIAETRGTVFHGKRHDEKTIIECFAMLAERNSLAAIHRIKGIKEETVMAWLRFAATQMAPVEELLIRDHRMTRVQLDALWSYVGHKGEKKGSRKKTSAARSGAEQRSRPIRDYALDVPLPKPKKKSRKK
jgi:transposase-like protein